MKIACDQRSDDTAVEGADETDCWSRGKCQLEQPDKLVVGKTQHAPATTPITMRRIIMSFSFDFRLIPSRERQEVTGKRAPGLQPSASSL